MEKNLTLEIANEIKKRRIELKIKQVDLARALGVKRNTIRNWENGFVDINIKKLIKICELLNLELKISINQKLKGFDLEEFLQEEDDEIMKIIGDNNGII